MTWQELRAAHPDTGLVVEVHASRQDGKRIHFEDMSVVHTHWPELIVEDVGPRSSPRIYHRRDH